MKTAGAALATAVIALIGCAQQRVESSPRPSMADAVQEPCNPLNGSLSGPTRVMKFSVLEVTTPAQWVASYRTMNDLDFTRSGATLTVWKGSEFVFPRNVPMMSQRCEIVRGDTTIRIHATMESGFNYRVDVTWTPLIDGQHFYMQLSTRSVEHLKQMRGIIESVKVSAPAAASR